MERGSRRVTFLDDSVIEVKNDSINHGSDEQENMENEQESSIIQNIPFAERLRECLSKNPAFEWIPSCSFTFLNFLWIITHIIIVIVTYGAFLFLLGDSMLPGGKLFGLYWLVIASYALGWSIAYIPYINLPPVFGMLLAGIIIRSTGLYNIHEEIGFTTTSKIRNACIALVTIRAGLQLSTTALVKHPIFLILLGLAPCTVEFIVNGIYSKYVLGYPWSWAFLAGTIMACLSPVVTVNCILALAEKGYGEDRDMATLFTTASSIDGIHMVSLYSLCYSIVFSGNEEKQNLWWAYLPVGLRDLFLGLFFGFIIGLLFAFLPYKDVKYIEIYRTSCLIIGSLMCTLGANSVTITGGGYLASVFMSFIASTGWKILSGSSLTVMPLRRTIHVLWHISQPVLAGIIGAEIDFSHWSSQRFGLHVICLFIGLMAALAPMTLETAQQNLRPDEISLAMDVVQMSLLAIVVLAPVGAVIMTVTGPLLLNRIDDLERDRQRRLSLLRMRSLQPIHDESKHYQQKQSPSSSSASLSSQQLQIQSREEQRHTDEEQSYKHLETT